MLYHHHDTALHEAIRDAAPAVALHVRHPSHAPAQLHHAPPTDIRTIRTIQALLGHKHPRPADPRAHRRPRLARRREPPPTADALRPPPAFAPSLVATAPSPYSSSLRSAGLSAVSCARYA